MQWRKSSFSGGDGQGNCVEVAWPAPQVAVRDSKAPHGRTLAFSRSRWRVFLARV
ncbi:DUF397 domain-containing protein [Actinokineospora xionganensis]|uniref:DUF397 domain-containing protein n=1 Tax=Actinokineospora xionganensis TaxID=2684470 RepID=UPI0028A7B8CB|nr:DUF397 domain-containing protein [Actinokineospora xionganensis]